MLIANSPGPRPDPHGRRPDGGAARGAPPRAISCYYY